MSDMHSLADLFYYTNRREYSHRVGKIAYLDGKPLSRPLSMPMAQRLIAAVVVVIAIAAGVMFFNNTVLAGLREAAEAEKAVEANLARESSIETLPNVGYLINMSDDDVRAWFQDQGYTMYDATDPEEQGTMSLYKLPADVTVEEAAAAYKNGISTLTAPQATKLLNGSWHFADDRDGITTMVVRYADFSTGDPEKAVQRAMTKEGLGADTVTDSGEDDSGNTYSAGTLDSGGTICTWKISAVPLDEMFSVTNLPEDACYVGVRVTIKQ